MKIRCHFCGTIHKESEECCPDCGMSDNGTEPRTLTDLKDFCEINQLPLEKIRFFIGKDCKEPKCFGIYEDNGHFIVYKNKTDGARAVKYEGYDEAYAVTLIYDKLKEEIGKRNLSKKAPVDNRSFSVGSTSKSQNEYKYDMSVRTHKKGKDYTGLIIGFATAVTVIAMIVLFIMLFIGIAKSDSSPVVHQMHSDKSIHHNRTKGYYEYLDDYYYYDGYDYYIYDPYMDEWEYYKDDDDFYLGGTYWMDYDDAYDMFYGDPYFDDWYSDYDYYNYDYNDYYNYDYDDYYDYEDDSDNWWNSFWNNDDSWYDDDDSSWYDDSDDDDSWWSDWDDDDWDYDYDDWDSWDTDWDTDW